MRKREEEGEKRKDRKRKEGRKEVGREGREGELLA